MKKLLAIFLCAALLLSACALAEGGELTLSNIQLKVNGSPVDLSGIDLRLAYAKDGENTGARLAIDGNGEELASLTASLRGEELLLAAAGVSSVYALSVESEQSDTETEALSFTEQELNELKALWDGWREEVRAACTELASEESAGTAYKSYAISASEEQNAALLFGIADILDRQSAVRAAVQTELGGTDSLRALLESSGITVSAEGTMRVAEQEREESFDLLLTINSYGLEEPEHVGVELVVAELADEGSGDKGVDVSARLYDADDAQNEDDAELGLTVTLDSATETFTGMDGYVLRSEGESEEGLYFGVYGPETQGNGLWQLSLTSLDDSFSANVAFGKSEDLDGLYILVYSGDSALEFYYDAGQAGLSVFSGDASYSVTADAVISDTDGGWLALDGANAVDALNMTDAQSQTLQTELMALLLNLISGLAAANETVAALVGSLMG